MAAAARLAAASYVPPPPPRRVGRPAKRPVVELEPPVEESEQKKRKYTHWFSTPLIDDIIAAYKIANHSARATVAYLQRSHPTLYSDLKESTVRSWFDATTHELHPQFSELLVRREYAGGPGRDRAFADFPEAEEQIMAVLMKMRSERAGNAVNIDTIRWVMSSIIRDYAGLSHLKLSKAFISEWAHSRMSWSFRRSTTAASKLPEDWHQRGVDMAKRIAAQMETYGVHESLVINFDQAGLLLVPAASRTYELSGSRAVPVAGQDDKRQITVLVGSSLDGGLLPLQLIFQGKTAASLPPHSTESKKFGFHLTQSANHWSNQQTMQQYVEQVIEPWRRSKIVEHNLSEDAHVILVVDVWGVHLSAEFRAFLPSYIHLVYVPANCTSKLQVADVVLNYPFKHGFKRRFNKWAAEAIHDQIQQNEIVGIKHLCGMTMIKPKVLEWALESWKALRSEKVLIQKGWNLCVLSLYDVTDKEQRLAAMRDVVRRDFDPDLLPDSEEKEEEVDSDGFCCEESSDDEKSEKQIMRERVFGERKSARAAQPRQSFGYVLNTTQLKFS